MWLEDLLYIPPLYEWEAVALYNEQYFIYWVVWQQQMEDMRWGEEVTAAEHTWIITSLHEV